MPTKILSNLTAGTVAPGEPFESHAFLSTVHDEPVHGFIRQVTLGPGGLQVRHGQNIAAIPLAEILKLAETSVPELKPAGANPDAPLKRLN